MSCHTLNTFNVTLLYDLQIARLTAYSTYSDPELLLLLAQGDQYAFEMIYTRHWQDLYKSAFIILKDHDASKDIIQNIFVWIWEHKQELKITSLKSYLKAAVKFKVANYIRSGKIRNDFFQELANFNFSALPIREELTETRELNAIIQQAIAHLPQKCREIFLLSREENLTNQEIAKKLGISIKTVENQMTIALQRMRTAISFVAVLLFYIYLQK